MASKINQKLSSRAVEQSTVLEVLNREIVPVVEKIRLALDEVIDELPPSDASYLVLSANDRLENERILTAGTHIQIDDGGPGQPATISANLDERVPTQMVFTEVFHQDWLDTNVAGLQDTRLLPPALQQLQDTFSDATTGRFTNVTESNACTISIAANALTLTAAAGAARMSLLYESGSGSLAMPQQFASVQVTGQTGSFGAYCAILCGFVKDGNNYCVLNWSAQTGTLVIQNKVAGVNHFDTSVVVAAAYPTTVAMSVVGTRLTVYAKTAAAPNVWIKVSSFDMSAYLDFKAQDLSLWYSCFGHASPGTFANTITFKNFQYGRFGGVGIRDVCMVTHEDGSPYFASDSTVYALATLAGAGGGISEGSQGVFLIDLEKKTFTQTGLLMVSRGGKIQNDHAGHMIREDNGDQHLSISTWGDTPAATRVVYKFITAATDLLSGANVVASMTTLALTVVAAGSQYDPFLIRKIGVWYMAYTCAPVAPPTGTPFFPALDQSSDLSTWTNIGSDTSAARYEGTRILPFNDQSYVLTGGQFNMKMYTLAMVYVGIVNCISPGDGTTQPHAMIFPYQSLDLLITFDQTKWPTAGGLSFSWGSIRWFASPRY